MEPDLKQMILYEDSSILVLHKKAGIPVQDKRSRVMDLESMVRNDFALRGSREPYVGVVHRLDLPVEGIVVFGKDRKAAAVLSSQIQKGQMRKEYLAAVTGCPGTETGELRDYLLKDGRTNRSAVVKKGTAGAKEAVLTYTLLEQAGEASLLKIQLHTGRHHQIRVQLSHAGMPVLGDRKYGTAYDGGADEKGIALCAFRLTFRHPEDGIEKTFEVKPSGSWYRIFYNRDGNAETQSTVYE